MEVTRRFFLKLVGATATTLTVARIAPGKEPTTHTIDIPEGSTFVYKEVDDNLLITGYYSKWNPHWPTKFPEEILVEAGDKLRLARLAPIRPGGGEIPKWSDDSSQYPPRWKE